MKRITQLVVLLAAIGMTLPAAAEKRQKEPKDQEYRRVVLTLKTGERIEGYLTAMWQPAPLQFKRPNYSLKLAETPDGKRGESTKYTADEVAEVAYTEPTSEYPEGIVWESHPVASPSIGNRDKTYNMFVCKDASSEHATVYWYKNWTTQQTGNISRRVLITIFCLRFHDDPDGIVYPYELLNTVLLKEKKPGFREHIKEWFKGAEGKERKKERKDGDYAWMLDCYEAYLAAQQTAPAAAQ